MFFRTFILINFVDHVSGIYHLVVVKLDGFLGSFN